MSLRNSYQSFYSEGVASEHPDISGQEDFAKKADVEIERRRKARAKKAGPQLPSFVKSVRKEELEIEEAKKMKGKDPCWKGYEMVGTKKKGGKEVPNCVPKEEYLPEEEMTTAQKKKESRLKAKYDKSGMKQNMIDQYGEEKGTQIYFAKIRKEAMAEDIDYDDAYNYIIEMLVAADFAESYESAEVMFEHMSDEFTSVILEEYIEEKARGTRKKTTVHAYDVDETLFGHGKKGKPNVQVHVNDASGKRVKSLSNQEFNTHKLDKGHSYDFSEFQSAKKFSQTASPNKKVIKDIKRKQARGQNVHLITARSKFDKPSEFQGHLKKHGINVDKSNIHYTGGMKGGDVGQKKVKVANAVAKKSGAKSVHMYDDAAKVHKAFEAEKKEKPKSKKIKTHMVAPDKSGESRVRSYQATKNEEMTAYEYWKQFID